jgi:hypothetical protein
MVPLLLLQLRGLVVMLLRVLLLHRRCVASTLRLLRSSMTVDRRRDKVDIDIVLIVQLLGLRLEMRLELRLRLKLRLELLLLSAVHMRMRMAMSLLARPGVQRSGGILMMVILLVVIPQLSAMRQGAWIGHNFTSSCAIYTRTFSFCAFTYSISLLYPPSVNSWIVLRRLWHAHEREYVGMRRRFLCT